jgi:hypothetical protein
MPEDKTHRKLADIPELLLKLERLRFTGRVSHWDYSRHLTRRPFDYCPFECGFCEELRQFDECLRREPSQQTPVL